MSILILALLGLFCMYWIIIALEIIAYFNSFGAEHILKETKVFIGN